MAAKKSPTSIRQNQIVETAFLMMSESSINCLHIKDIAERVELAPRHSIGISVTGMR